MKKIVDLLKSFVAVLIVMTGTVLLNFYITHRFSILSIILGIIGFAILFPAVKKWEKTLWGENAN